MLSRPASAVMAERADERDDFVRSEASAGVQAHFFNPAVRFRTMVIGDNLASLATTFMSTRCPSDATAYCPCYWEMSKFSAAAVAVG